MPFSFDSNLFVHLCHTLTHSQVHTMGSHLSTGHGFYLPRFDAAPETGAGLWPITCISYCGPHSATSLDFSPCVPLIENND